MRKTLAILLCIAILTLTGCGKISQLHERLIVQGIGVDIVDDKYVVTMQVFDAINSGSTEEESLVVSAQGESVLDAFNAITLQTGKEPLYSQNMVILLGEEAAGYGIDYVMDFFVRYYEARPEVDIFVVKDTAMKALQCKGENGKLLKAEDMAFLAETGELNASAMQSTVRQVVEKLQNQTSDPHMIALRLQERGEGYILSADGTAIFDDDVLTGYLSLHQTQGALMLLGEAANGTQVIELPEIGNVTYSFMGVKSDIKVEIEDNRPVFQIQIKANANIFEIDRDLSEKLPTDTFDVMKTALEQRIQQLCTSAVQEAVLNRHCDIFDFGKRLWKQQPETYRKLSGHWKKEMANCSYQIHAEVGLKRVGQEANPL